MGFSVAEKSEVEFWYFHANKLFSLVVRSIQTAEPPLLSSKATTNPCLLPPLAMYCANCRAATFVVGSNDTVGDVQFFCCPALIAMNVVDAANTNKINSCMNEHT